MCSVGRVIAMVFDGTSSAQSQSQESTYSACANKCLLIREWDRIHKLKSYEYPLNSKGCYPKRRKKHGDSSGKNSLGETPQCVARGGSAAPAESAVFFPER